MSTGALLQQRTGTQPGQGTALPWKKISLILILLSFALSALSLAVPPLTGVPYQNYDGWLRGYLDLGREGNFPTWWTSALHLLAATASVMAGLIYVHRLRRVSVAWLVFAVILLAFAVDEATLIHDRSRHLANLVFPGNSLEYAWLGVGIPLAVAVFVVVYFCARRLPHLPRKLLILGFGVFFVGAVGFEFLHGLLTPYIGDGFLWVAVYHVEEFLEMCGVSLILASPLASIRYRFAGSDLVLAPVPPNPSSRPAD